MSNKSFLVLVVIFFLLSSCQHKEVYYRFHSVKNDTWNKEAAFDFVLDSLPFDANKRYDINIEIANSSRYAYQNIWLFVQQNIADTAFVIDTLEIKLADTDGKWLGNGTTGIYQLSVPYKSSITLDSTREYLISIRQGMKDNSLKGIDKVGLLVK